MNKKNFSDACQLAKASGNDIIVSHFEEHWKDMPVVWHKSGHGFICVKQKEFQGKMWTKVYYLVVDKEHQRKGIASELLASVKGNVLYVTESGTVGAEELCKKSGFKQIGQMPNEFNGTDIYYGKQPNKASNNGGSTSYYDFEKGWKEAGDIIEGRKMNFNQGSMFKCTFCFNIGRHSATDYERELNKLIYFAQRELKRIK